MSQLRRLLRVQLPRVVAMGPNRHHGVRKPWEPSEVMGSFHSMAGAGMQSRLFPVHPTVHHQGSISRSTSGQFLVLRTFMSNKDKVEHKEAMKELTHLAKRVKNDSKVLECTVLLFLGVLLSTASGLPAKISSIHRDNAEISADINQCNEKLETVKEKITSLEATLEEERAKRSAEASKIPPPLAEDSSDSAASSTEP